MSKTTDKAGSRIEANRSGKKNGKAYHKRRSVGEAQAGNKKRGLVGRDKVIPERRRWFSRTLSRYRRNGDGKSSEAKRRVHKQHDSELG